MEDGLSASTRLIRIELCPHKGLKVQAAVLPVKLLSFFRSGWKRRVEKERDRALLPILHTAYSSSIPCFWNKQQRDIKSKALLCKSGFLLEIGGDKIPSSSPLKNFLGAHGYLKVNHSPASQPLKQNQNKKACV